MIDEEIAKIHEELHAKANDEKEFLGWMELPTNYDKEEFDRIKIAANKIKNATPSANMAKPPKLQGDFWVGCALFPWPCCVTMAKNNKGGSLMKIGYSRIDITPTEPVPLAGYGNSQDRISREIDYRGTRISCCQKWRQRYDTGTVGPYFRTLLSSR